MTELLEALQAAGLDARAASRIASAVRSVVQAERQSVFSARTGSQVSPAPAASGAYALYAKGPAAYDPKNDSLGRGQAALGVSGLAVVDGQLVVRGDQYCAALLAKNAIAARSASIGSVEAQSLSVQRAAQIDSQQSVFASPVTINAGLVSKAGAQFSGENVFDGPVTIQNKVNWKGPRDPAAIQIPYSFTGLDSGKIIVQTRNVAVLNDFGNGPAAALSASISALTRYVAVTLLGETVTVLSGASFDPDSCVVVGETTTVFNCTGVSAYVTSASTSAAGPWFWAVTNAESRPEIRLTVSQDIN
jgi:hypothetical protein